jgi:cytochrome oxidase Cu insertion factor (SCO1/SenC/PrrC family)
LRKQPRVFSFLARRPRRRWGTVAGPAARREAVLEIGQTAPDFTVPDHEGRSVRLRDLRGRKVLLWFYPKADTPG